MPLLKDCVDQKKFDVRVIEKNLARGFVQIKEVDDTLGGLDDDAQTAEWVNTEELAGDDN